MRKSLLFLFVCAALSCGKNNDNNGGTNNGASNNGGSDAGNNGGVTNNVSNNGDADMGDDDTGMVERPAVGCDSLDPSVCSLPWPSNLYLEPDAERASGYTLSFGTTSLPANNAGVNVDPDVFTRRDGYSLGTSIVAVFPNVDPTLLPDENAIEDSLADDAHAVLLEVDDAGNAVGKVPYWFDYDAQEDDLAKRAVVGHPSVILKPSTRYVVAFRGLTDTDGAAIPPSAAFAALVAGDTASNPDLFFRQERFDEIFGILDAQGWAKDDLTLAWDFVTASDEETHAPLLHIIDDALATTGEMGPELTVTEVREFTADENADIAFEISGTFEVPHYMREFRGVTSSPQRWELNIGDDGLPEQNGTRDADFWVRVPRSALDGTPHGLVMYGHGLLGSGTQVRGGHNSAIANGNNLIFFAADMIGMSEDEGDEGAVAIVQDFNRFPFMGDRLIQGQLEWVLLSRAMRERFGSLTEVTDRGVVVNQDELFYSGISQGGIFGATFVAVSPDIDRGHLGVPGHTYSVLLHRSVDFTQFFVAMKAAYPDSRDQMLLLQLAQLLWDFTDPVSYYRNLTTPLAGRNPKEVLLAPAKGDYQVAVIQNEVVARSDIGIPLLENYDDEREPALITPVSYPRDGSGVVLYDFGDPWPAAGNHTDTFWFGGSCDSSADCDEANGQFCSGGTCSRDPHGKPRRQAHHTQQMVEFFRTGVITDVCGGDGCRPD